MVHVPFAADQPRQRRLLRALDQTRILTLAARECRVGVKTVARARASDRAFDAEVTAILAKPSLPARRFNPFLPADRQRFLDALATSGCVQHAADATPVPACTAYALRRRDRQFAAAWADARDDARDRAYGRMLKGAIDGFVRTETVVDGVKRIVSHDPRSVLALLDHHRAVDGDGGQPPEPRPEQLRTARASLVRKLVSGGGLTTMAEAIEAAAATTLEATAIPLLAAALPVSGGTS